MLYELRVYTALPGRMPVAQSFSGDRGPIDCIPARCDILDLEGDDIAATQLLVQHGIGSPAASVRAAVREAFSSIRASSPCFGLVRRDGGEHTAHAKRFITELGAASPGARRGVPSLKMR